MNWAPLLKERGACLPVGRAEGLGDSYAKEKGILLKLNWAPLLKERGGRRPG